jgi:hypothetical protein
MDTETPLRLVRGIELRYALVRILQICGPSTVAELVDELPRWGFTVAGRPSKTISDALRWEVRRDRVRRSEDERGFYWAGCVPRATAYRIIHRVQAMRAEAVAARWTLDT